MAFGYRSNTEWIHDNQYTAHRSDPSRRATPTPLVTGGRTKRN